MDVNRFRAATVRWALAETRFRETCGKEASEELLWQRENAGSALRHKLGR